MLLEAPAGGIAARRSRRSAARELAPSCATPLPSRRAALPALPPPARRGTTCRRPRLRLPTRASAEGGEERITDSDLAALSARVSAARAAEVAADRRCAAAWRSGRCTQRTVAVLADWVRHLRFCGDTLVCGTYGGAVHVIDMRTGVIARTLFGLSAEVTALDYDGASVAAGAIDGTVCRWDASTGEGGQIGTHAAAVTAVQLEGCEGVVSACAEGVVAAHGCFGGRQQRCDAPVCSLQRAGHYTAAGLADGRVLLWAGLGGEGGMATPGQALLPRQILAFAAHASPVLCLQLLSADGVGGGAAADASAPLTRLATGGADGVVRMWDLAAGGAPLRRFAAHRAPVSCLQADGSKLVSGGRDGTIRVWDLATGRQRFSMSGFTAYLDALQFEGSRLISSGTNNLVAQHDFGGEGAADDAAEED